MIGKEVYADGGTDVMEDMFYSIESRIKDELVWTPSNIGLGGITYQTKGNIRNIK